MINTGNRPCSGARKTNKNSTPKAFALSQIAAKAFLLRFNYAAKSIKNTDTAKGKGYDSGKKISGIKLHVVVNTIGLPPYNPYYTG